MKISIQGIDYTSALDAAHLLSIERRLNAPSFCMFSLILPANASLALPKRLQYLIVQAEDSTLAFTGYIAATPLPAYAGLALEGPRYRYAIQAVSDELLLDQLLFSSAALSSAQTIAQLFSALVTRTGSSILSTQGLTLATPINNYLAADGASWSTAAGDAATQSRAAYRAVNGALSLTAIGSVLHPLNESDGSLDVAQLSFTASARRALANDLTVCGEHEPTAYITEYFLGDASTSAFYLSAAPFALSAAKSTFIDELFNEAQINPALWSLVSGPGYLSLGASGLAIAGGNGIDGDTTLSWQQSLELGGTLLLEASGVTVQAGGSGVLSGVYTGVLLQAGCLAGFQVSTRNGVACLQPLVSGSPAGTLVQLNSAAQYTLRIRLHCAEPQRTLSCYQAFTDSGIVSAGGATNTLAALVQMEVQPTINGVAGTPVTLFDGAIAALPPTAMIVAVSSINMAGSLRALRFSSLGSAWITSTPSGGTARTRRLGNLAESAECELSRSGKLTFFTGYTPAAGEQIAVRYRAQGRAVGRAVNAASQQALIAAGSPSVACWIGSVTSPAARSSADCRNAASVLVQSAASASALWAGKITCLRNNFASDVWPGDALQLNAPSLALSVQVVVRTVKLLCASSRPDCLRYEITFANDWADDLAIKTSASVPADTSLPALIAPTFLANLSALTVTALSATSVSVNAGIAPPTGGGFEVRRRDNCFQPGSDSDLVERSSTQNFILARQSANDCFFIRAYDNSTPPNYSEFSAALFINLPLS
jgi:hypothetical protein